MQFSKLDDTEFPNLSTASPYALKNTFDYTRWVPDTQIHMVNVLWNPDYENVVKFENDSKRNAWFDSIQDTATVTLKSNARMIPDGTVKVPLPYDVAATYNYLYIDVPIATSRERMIQDETESGIRRWYFFVLDVSYSAPNTTVLTLKLDVWTQFIDTSRITYMMLERGHAPVSASDTDEYLKNPIGNNRYLLAPDVSYDDTSIVRDSEFVPFGNGKKYIVIASTCGYASAAAGEFGTVKEADKWEKPTYSDTKDWYGHQLKVSGYTFSDGKNYTDTNVQVGLRNRPRQLLPTGVLPYAIPAEDDDFLTDCKAQCPTFLRTFVALWLVDENMLQLGDKMTIAGHEVYRAYGVDGNIVKSFDLNKSMFGFEEDEQRFAKLYTYPYSRIEFSDNSGKTAEVRIENTGKLSLQLFTSMAYPALNCRAFLDGINGVGSQSYTWKNMNGEDLKREIPNGDWGKLTFELGIPTFAFYMDAGTMWEMDNYSNMQAARDRALTAYENSARDTNLGYYNSSNVAQVANDNDSASAQTASDNSNATTRLTNYSMRNAYRCGYHNAVATMKATTYNATLGNYYSTDLMYWNNDMSETTTQNANEVSVVSTNENNHVTAATTQQNNLSNMSTGIINGGVSGALAGGSIAGPVGAGVGGVAGGLVGAATSGISAQCASNNAAIITNASKAVTDLAVGSNGANNRWQILTSITTTGIHCRMRDDQAASTKQVLDIQAHNNWKSSAANALNLKTVQYGNTKRTKNTADANIKRTKDNADDRNEKSRDIGILNAKANLELQQRIWRDSLRDAKRSAPIAVTSATGDPENWALCQNGVQFRVRTQSDSAIRQASSQFARYGYALNQIWDVSKSGLNLMKNFTYWKASNVWVDVRGEANSRIGDALTGIFENGVTVWSNPDAIGKVGIYDN